MSFVDTLHLVAAVSVMPLEQGLIEHPVVTLLILTVAAGVGAALGFVVFGARKHKL